jgi:hypothetical protein
VPSDFRDAEAVASKCGDRPRPPAGEVAAEVAGRHVASNPSSRSDLGLHSFYWPTPGPISRRRSLVGASTKDGLSEDDPLTVAISHCTNFLRESGSYTVELPIDNIQFQ